MRHFVGFLISSHCRSSISCTGSEEFTSQAESGWVRLSQAESGGALAVGHDHTQTQEAAQYNHSLICWPLEQLELSALLRGTWLLVMRQERVLPFTLLTQIYAACPRTEPETATVQKLSKSLWNSFLSSEKFSDLLLQSSLTAQTLHEAIQNRMCDILLLMY